MSLGILEGWCPATPAGIVESIVCVAASWEVPILAGLLVVAATGVWRRMQSRRERDDRSPLLVFPLTGGATASGGTRERRPPPEPRRTSPDAAPERASAGPPEKETHSHGPRAEAPEKATQAPPARSPRPTPTPPAEPAARGTNGPPAESDPAQRMVLPPAEAGADGTVSYQRPPDGTLQLLPGRLEIARGPGVGEEIRFVRVPGVPAEITFGRGEGPEFRHVRLDSPTVSRQHARLAFRQGSWTIRNESSTNPTTVNGRTLSSDVEEVALNDGDRIEMGDIVFSFRHEGVKDRLPFRSSWHTDLGRRPTNQDAVIVRSLPGGRELAAVADGMGSHHAGGVASQTALEALVMWLSEGADLKSAMVAANRAVCEKARRDGDQEGMGTTLVALLREEGRYEIANVGDSRAYRLGADGIQQLTTDHSFRAEATREGRMSEDEAARSPWRNAVTRSLGTEADIEVDLFPGFDAGEDHVVILCTDGVHGVLSDEEIEAVCRETQDIRDLSRALSEKALMSGGEDNVAVAAMAFGSPVASASPTPAV